MHSERGFEIGGAYNDGPFWTEPYNSQYMKMSRVKNKVENCINKPMRIFHSKYFAYNEDTLKIAVELGVEYILARGTAGARAVVYKPRFHWNKRWTIPLRKNKGEITPSS